MRELAAAAAVVALAKKCKRTKPKTEKENKVSEAEVDLLSQLAAISYPNKQAETGWRSRAKNQNRYPTMPQQQHRHRLQQQEQPQKQLK